MKGQNNPPMLTLRNLLAALLLVCGSLTAHAQFQFGGGAHLGLNFNQFGVQARGQYTVNETWRGAANFTFYFPEVGTAWEFNPNAHYVFLNDETKTVYALAGLGIYRFGLGNDDLGLGGLGIRTSFTDVGLNVGGGINLPLGPVTGYAEAKFGIGGSEFGVSVGVLFGN